MNYVVCLKWGTKYGPEYVNRLANMVSRNITVDHQFVCFTENTAGLSKNIRTCPLPKYPLTGWWYKPYFFSSDVPLKGTLLFLDLDIVVFDNIDKLFDYEPGKFCIIRDFNRNTQKNLDYMNSSVFRVESGQYHSIWNDYIKNHKLHLSRNRGDQDWMQKNIKDHVYWPDEWIQSYKWEMRSRNDLTVVNGRRNFKDDKPPQILPDTSIAVFHGMPNPEECNDSWVKQHWV
jgi:hypothetical protein